MATVLAQITAAIDSTMRLCLPYFRISSEVSAWPTHVATNPKQKHARPYCSGINLCFDIHVV